MDYPSQLGLRQAVDCLKDEAEELNYRILLLIKDFEARTNLCVDSIDVKHTMTYEQKDVACQVECQIKFT